MSDILLELGKNPQARNLIKSLGLPIPVPQDLRRAKGPRAERPLEDRDVAVCAAPGGAVVEALAAVLAEAGANPHVVDPEAAKEAFAASGEAFGRPPEAVDLEGAQKFHGLVLDATSVADPAGLRALYDFFHPLVRRVRQCGRAVVIGRNAESADTVGAAAAQAALDGFVRSLAKEMGKKGSTATLLRVAPGAEALVAGPLRFLLSERSAYVSGQPLEVSTAAGKPTRGPWACPLEGKVVLVTGAARGIGAATAKIFADEGAKVVCLDRPQDDGPTSKLARSIGGEVLLCDVTDEKAPETISGWLKEHHGGVDVVIHNAGITRDRTIAKMSDAWWDMTLDVNLGAVLRITQRLLDDGTLRDQGRLLLLSSIAGIAGNMGQTNYAASKAGIIGLVEHLARDLAGRGITVNGIAPGFIETRLTHAIPFAIREAARRMNNLGQGGQPQDVGQALAFLATPAAQGVTGQVLRVCGGSLVGR